MGMGDQLMATGMARGANARGKRIGFGDGRDILWDKHSAEMFQGNPNIAPPGAERDLTTEWVGFYKGHRLYNRQAGDRWVWNMDFRPTPGEVFFSTVERRNATRFGKGFVLIEPNVPVWKTVAPNKDWGRENYQQVADRLRADGFRVVQFRHPQSPQGLRDVEQLQTLNFRDALGLLARSALYVGAEGGLHHGAAAVGIPAVVLFGGFIPPAVTGYPSHTNLTGGAEACGSIKPCAHCQGAMRAISADEVVNAAMETLSGRDAAERRQLQIAAPGGGLP